MPNLQTIAQLASLFLDDHSWSSYYCPYSFKTWQLISNFTFLLSPSIKKS